MQGQGQKYGQKHETKELVEFHNHLHALTMSARKNIYEAEHKTVSFWVCIVWWYSFFGDLNSVDNLFPKETNLVGKAQSKGSPFFLFYCIRRRVHRTPYSKMAAILVFFCFHANWPLWPRFQTQNSKEYLTLNEAIRANLHGNKRILKWRPFWNKVYSSPHQRQKRVYF